MTFGHDVFGINGYGIGNQIFRAAGTADDFTGDKVKVFQHCMADEMFSEGWTRSFGEGEYDTNDFPNDDASAMWIPAGYTVVASQHSNTDDSFPGKQMTFTGPLAIECLVDKGFNDDISNLVITYAEPTSNGDDDLSTQGEVVEDSPNYLLYGVIGAVIVGALVLGG